MADGPISGLPTITGNTIDQANDVLAVDDVSLSRTAQITVEQFRLTQITEPTAAYTLLRGDANGLVLMQNATAATVTVPPNATAAFPVGTFVRVARGNADVTIVEGAGVTIDFRVGLGLSFVDQWSLARLVKTGTDTWLLTGDMQEGTPAAVDPVENAVIVVSAVANVVPGGVIDPVESVALVVSDTADIDPTADIDGTESVAVVVSDVADVVPV